MKESDAVKPGERSYTDSAPPAEVSQPLTFALTPRDVRARRWSCLWALGAVIVPFLTTSAVLVLPDGATAIGGGAVGLLLGGCCLWRVPLPLAVRGVLLSLYLLVMPVVLLWYTLEIMYFVYNYYI